MGTRSIYGMAIATAFFWGANFLLAGVVMAELSPFQAAAGRFALAFLTMLPIIVWRGDGWAAWAALKDHGLRLGMIGVIGVAGFNILFFHALLSTSGVNGALMMATNPLLTSLMAALLLKEKVPARQWLAMPVSAGGVALVILGKGQGGALGINAGDLEMVAANLVWALYNVMVRKLSPPGPQLANVGVTMGLAALALLVAAVAEGRVVDLPGPVTWAALSAMAILGSSLAYLFWSTAIAGLGAGRTALFLNLVPVFAALLSAALGQPPSLAQVMGGAVVIAAVGYAMMPPKPNTRRTPT